MVDLNKYGNCYDLITWSLAHLKNMCVPHFVINT